MQVLPVVPVDAFRAERIHLFIHILDQSVELLFDDAAYDVRIVHAPRVLAVFVLVQDLIATVRIQLDVQIQLFEDFLVDATEGGIPESYYESKKLAGKKLEEAVDYSAVKFPAGSEAEGEDLVEAYEKTQASRRKAIKNFRESVIKNNENNVAPRNSRFAEALKSSVRTNSRPSSSSSNSWSNNRFVEKMEEREELDFKALIRDGFLG